MQGVTKPINRLDFYTKVRAVFGSLTEKQVQGFEAILNEWQKRSLVDVRWLAYIFATVWHETGHSMQPIEEYDKGKGRAYGGKLKMGGGPGKRVPYTTPDKIYYGRGHTQNTWYENYEALTNAAVKQGKGWNFLTRPEWALDMDASIWATFHAMTTGMYTGKKLSDFFTATTCDWLGARTIINGHDCDYKIKGYALSFHDALT
jgi:putative chitinase